ncbi:microsomal glutathione S-transferase 3 [Aplysia californica]|uniref:Microsomal glutathione S-transferase 3 n=1 Tax=Aplysia californica TaxID=6500 RepID=A0ABM1A2L0_APLCA|nr:microsomal glutathione S-transferase 3 [Aplysia californica]
MAAINFQLSSDFGFVILVVVTGWVFLQYLAMNVMKARKKYDVKYPALYSDKSPEFNCVQRAHQNTLEVYPQFLIFLLLGGLQMPRLSAVFGILFLIGRFMYAQGYYTFDPSKRNRGAIAYIGFFGLFFNTIYFALNLLGVV